MRMVRKVNAQMGKQTPKCVWSVAQLYWDLTTPLGINHTKVRY